MTKPDGKPMPPARLRDAIDRHPRPWFMQEEPPAVAEQTKAKAKPKPKCAEPTACTKTKITKTGANGDEEEFPSFIGNYHKGLPHDCCGKVEPAAYQKLLEVLQAESGFDQIPLSATVPPGLQRKLCNPQAGLATDLEGPNPKDLAILAAPKVDSAEAAAEAVELYWMALLRDVPFTRFDSHAMVADAAQEISGLKDFTGPEQGGKVTAGTIFRGCTAGDLVGPFVSQYLLHDIPYGSLLIPQRQLTVVPAIDYMTDFGSWLAVQNGIATHGDAVDSIPRHLRNMRDLARYVHVDALYEAYLNACLILLGHSAPFDEGNPYVEGRPDAVNQTGFGTFGGTHVLTLVTEVATRALKAVWWQKWFVHRRLRPEAYGGLIEVKKRGACGCECEKDDYPIDEQVLESKALAKTFDGFGSYLLPMAFPEGSPMHPSYGAGHATVAGACVTILKAFFDDLAPLPATLKPSVANDDGSGLVEYTGKGTGDLTIGGELDKLAANISIGRNMAGVHWRSDYTESIRLGETVALTILCNQRCDYHENDWSFSLCTFDGRRVKVDRNGVRDAKSGETILECRVDGCA